MTPDVSAARTRVLLALLHVYRRDGRVTVRALAEVLDMSVGSVHPSLCSLQAAGLVDWTPRCDGTLRPLVAPVPFGGTS